MVPPPFFFFHLLATPHRMWDLCFPSKGSNPHLLLWKCGVLTTGFPGEGPERKFRHRQMHSGEAEVKQRQGKMAFYQPGKRPRKKSFSLPCPHTDFGLVVSRTADNTLETKWFKPHGLRTSWQPSSIWRLTCSTSGRSAPRAPGIYVSIFSNLFIFH